MGVAKENRDRALTASQIDDEARHLAFRIMDQMNALPKDPRAFAPFGDVVILQNRGVWRVECPVSGFGFWYDSLADAVQSWRIALTGYDESLDKWTAIPIGRPGSRAEVI